MSVSPQPDAARSGPGWSPQPDAARIQIIDDATEGKGEVPLFTKRSEPAEPKAEAGDGARAGRVPRGLRQKAAKSGGDENAPQRAWMAAGAAAIGVNKVLLELRKSVEDPKTLDEVDEAFELLNVGLQEGTLGPREFDSHYGRMRDVKERLENPTWSTEVPTPPRGAQSSAAAWTPHRASYRGSGSVAERVSDSRSGTPMS